MSLAAWLHERLARGEAVVAVTVETARGSTPREVGALMLVSRDDLAGTIGGGSLEWSAVEDARAMIETSAEPRRDLPLGPLLGQCCGGHVTLSFAPADSDFAARLTERERAEADARPLVAIYGAGHVGRAIARAVALLPFRLLLIDSREAELARAFALPCLQAERPEEHVAELRAGDAALILTHSHALDFLVAEAALKRGDLAHVGMIGSDTKRARFLSWLVARGEDRSLADSLVLPLGGRPSRDKRPAIIAAFAAAELAARLAQAGPMQSRASL